MGRQGIKVERTEEEVLAAIKGSGGIMTNIAIKLDVTWHTAAKLINQWESTKQALNDEDETILDVAETQLINQVRAGEQSMIKFLLKTKGRKRGYVEERKVEHSGNVNHDHLHTLDDNESNRIEQQIDGLIDDVKSKKIKPKRKQKKDKKI